MRRPFRISVIAISAVLMLLTMQIDISAKKRSSKKSNGQPARLRWSRPQSYPRHRGWIQ